MASTKNKPSKSASVAKMPQDFSRWYLIIIIVSVFLVYGGSVAHQYVKMDDTDLIVDNEVFIRHLKNIPQAFRQSCFEIPGHLTDNKSYYRPMLIVSFIIDAQIHGARSSTTFHFMNILYHALCCMLLFTLLRKLSVDAGLAFVLTLIFAVHPVNVHAIAWVPGRNDILLSIFGLLSLHGLVDYYRKGGQGYLILHLVAYALALFTKESGVILLTIYIAFIWLWMRDLAFFKRKFVVLVWYFVITLVWLAAMQAALRGHEKIGGNGPITDVLTHNLPYLFLYIGKLVFPFNLNVMPGYDNAALVYGLLSTAVLVFLLWNIKDWRKALFAVFWYFVFIAPTLLVPELPAYEHRDYFPLIGLLIGLSQAGVFNGFKIGRSNITYGLGVVVIIFLIITITRIPVFADRFVFWNDGTEGTPFAPSACVNVGQLYQDMYDNDPSLTGKNKSAVLAKAGEWNHKALEMDSTTLRGNNNYGAFLYLTGHPDDALPYFKREIKFNPTNSDPYKNVAIYYKDKGMPDKSVPYWEKLIQLNRLNLQAYADLANYYRSIGNMDKYMFYAGQEKELSDEAEKQYNKIK